MNEPSTFGYGNEMQQASPAPGGLTHPAQYKFSQDELRVLSECNSESFFQRSLPLGTLFGLGTYAGVQSGRLKPNPRFGAFPKLTLAVVVGYFLGKLSYQQACAEKLMALPGSYIGQLLRDRRDGKITGTSLPKQSPSMFGANPGDIYSDAGPGSSLDLDTDRPLFSDDAYKPDSTGGATPPAEPAAPRASLSYDELRRLNRGEHADTKQDPYRIDPNPMPVITRAKPPPSPTPPTNKRPLPKQSPSMFGAKQEDIYSDAGPGSALVLDTSRPLFSDDAPKPDGADSATPPAEQGPLRASLFYVEHADTKQDPYSMEPYPMPVITRAKPPQSPTPPTNKYGEVND